VRFHNGATIAEVPATNNGSITSALVRFSAQTFDDRVGRVVDRRVKKGAIAHELWHCFGATDVSDPSSLMFRDANGSVVTLSPRDKLAAWLMNHDDAHPGNQAPDTNPSY
jgi:hypothetical protein